MPSTRLDAYRDDDGVYNPLGLERCATVYTNSHPQRLQEVRLRFTPCFALCMFRCRVRMQFIDIQYENSIAGRTIDRAGYIAPHTSCSPPTCQQQITGSASPLVHFGTLCVRCPPQHPSGTLCRLHKQYVSRG